MRLSPRFDLRFYHRGIHLKITKIKENVLANNDGIQPGPTLASPSTTELTFNSSSSELIFLFNWAKDLALSYVMTGTPNTIPCYEAAHYQAEDLSVYVIGNIWRWVHIFWDLTLKI